MLYANRGVTRYMRSGSPAHDDGRGWSSAQRPHQGRGPRPEQGEPYGPEVSWPSGFRAAQFDSGEYRALVESSYERDDYSHVDPRSADPRSVGRRHPGEQPYGEQSYGDQAHGGQPYGDRPYDDPSHGDRPYGDPAYGDQPGRGGRQAPRYQQPADDYGYGDPGYADPGYDGPGHDAQRGYQAPRRQSGPSGFAGPVGPASGPQPIYPVTGAQEVYREPVDPRLAGLRYDELRYDDTDLEDRGFSPRYDEPLDDDSWYKELRSSGPAQPQRQGGGRLGGGSAPYSRGVDQSAGGGQFGSGSQSGAGGQFGSGQSAGPRPSAGPAAGGQTRPAGPSGTVARNLAPGNGPGPRMSAVPATSAPARGLPRNPGSSTAFTPVRPQATAGFAPTRDRGYLDAPAAQVSVLTPPAGNRYDAGYTGPETVAWSMTDVDSGAMEQLEEYWEQEEESDVEYTALLADLDGDQVGVQRDTGEQPAVARQAGRRRGRSGDRRLWLGLGGVVAVAAASIFLIIKFEFPASSGPAHTLSMPDKIGSSFTSSKQNGPQMAKLRQEFVQMTHGQATDVLSGEYESGGPGMGGVPQIVMTIDAHLANDDPASSIADFMQDYKNAVAVPAGPLGGQAACAEEAGSNADNGAICAWFDNDSFGVVLSGSMNSSALAQQLQTFRSAVEHVATA
jgi:hypothetical protein